MALKGVHRSHQEFKEFVRCSSSLVSPTWVLILDTTQRLKKSLGPLAGGSPCTRPKDTAHVQGKCLQTERKDSYVPSVDDQRVTARAITSLQQTPSYGCVNGWTSRPRGPYDDHLVTIITIVFVRRSRTRMATSGMVPPLAVTTAPAKMTSYHGTLWEGGQATPGTFRAGPRLDDTS